MSFFNSDPATAETVSFQSDGQFNPVDYFEIKVGSKNINADDTQVEVNLVIDILKFDQAWMPPVASPPVNTPNRWGYARIKLS